MVSALRSGRGTSRPGARQLDERSEDRDGAVVAQLLLLHVVARDRGDVPVSAHADVAVEPPHRQDD
jgi:hypothetical protein